MPPRKGRLTRRKNMHSKTHIARAKERQRKRHCYTPPSSVPFTPSEVALQNQSLSNCYNTQPTTFSGFNVPPLKPSIRVLSLFDGIGTALHVLDKLKLHIDVYYSCEIDEKALKLQSFLYGDRVRMLGSVTELDSNKIKSLGKIDFLIGGSPCSDLSLVNHRRKGLTDINSSGVLFFEYVRVLKYLKSKATADGHPFYWLLENTSKMERDNRAEMSRHLECSPVLVNACDFLPVERRRFFWGNLPNMQQYTRLKRKTELNDILSNNRHPNVITVSTLMTSSHSQRKGKTKRLPVVHKNEATPLYITEVEAYSGSQRVTLMVPI